MHGAGSTDDRGEYTLLGQWANQGSRERRTVGSEHFLPPGDRSVQRHHGLLNRDHYYMHRAEEHLVRFRLGAARMGLVFPWSVDELLAGIMELLKHEPDGTQYIRPIAFRGGPELWVTGSEGRAVDVSIFTVRTEKHRDLDEPISCELSPVERISSRSIPRQIKVSGAYVNSFFARKTAEKSGAHDGLMFNREGHLAEASAANVFLIADDRLITPRLKPDVFPGITRQVVLEIARDKGIDTHRVGATARGFGRHRRCVRLFHPDGNPRDIKARRAPVADR